MSLKCFIADLQNSKPSVDGNVYFGGKLISQTWIQGHVVAIDDDENMFITIDDGSGQVLVRLPSLSCHRGQNEVHVKLGDYLLVQGGLSFITRKQSNRNELEFVNGHMFAILDNPNLETLWCLEVLTACR